MKSLLSGALTETIRSWVAEIIDAKQPRLCGEIENLSKINVIDIVCALLASWKVELFIFMINQGSRNISYIVNQDELQRILEKQIKDEEKCVFIDLKRVGGCTLDISNDGDTYCLFFASWGDREAELKELADNRDDLELFRGN